MLTQLAEQDFVAHVFQRDLKLEGSVMLAKRPSDQLALEFSGFLAHGQERRGANQ